MLAHDVDPLAASALTTTNISLAALDHLADVLPAETLGVAIRWAASDAAVRQAASQIISATRRVHELVSAVKGFTFMDREGVPGDVDTRGRPRRHGCHVGEQVAGEVGARAGR